MTLFGVFVLASIVSLLFAPGYRKGSYTSLILLFLVLFLAGIASQYWITPFGPVWQGISWAPLLFVILMLTFLFAAPSPYERGPVKSADGPEAPAPVVAAVSIFLWLFFTLVVIAILIGLLRTPAS